MIKSYEDLLQVGFEFLHLLQFNPLERYKPTFISILLKGCFLFVLYFLAYGFIYDEFTLDNFGQLVSICSTVLQCVTKMGFILIRHKNVASLVKDIDRFWPTEDYHYITTWHFVMKLYRIFGILVCTLFLIQGMLTGNLPIECHVPSFLPYPVFTFINSMAFYFAVIAAIGFDLTFCSYLILLKSQFQMLNSKLRRINYKDIGGNNRQQIKEIIAHHNYLFGFLDKFNTTYGSILLIYFGCIISQMCFVLYGIFKSTEKLTGLFKYGFYMMGLLMQFFMYYCFPAEQLRTEACSTPQKIIQSNWYECPDENLKKSLGLIILRSQKDINILAGKIIVLDLSNFLRVLKTTFTFYSALVTMDENRRG